VLFREAMVSMRQWQFKWVPPPVLDMLKTVFQGWCQSDTCENGFNVIKDHQRDTKSMAMARIQRYMLPHVEGVMEQFGRPELEPQAEDRAGHSRSLPKGAFDALAGQTSMPEEKLRKVMMSHPTWPRYTPLSAHTIPAATSLLQHVFGMDRWGDLASMWRSMFFLTGTVVREVAAAKVHLVLDSCQFGVLLWPCGDGVSSSQYVRPRVDKDAAPCWFHVSRFDLWEVLPVEPTSPLQRRFQQQQQAQPSPDCVEVRCAGEAEGVLRHAARHAFGKVPDAWLTRLITDMGLETLGGPAPVVFWERLELLVTHFLPDCTPAEVAIILASRCKAGRDTGIGQPGGLLQQPEAMECAHGVLDSSDVKQCKEHVEDMTATKTSHLKLVHFLQSKKYPLPKDLEALRHKVPQSVRATPSGAKQQVHLMRANAKQHLPKAKGVVLQPYPRKCAYQVYYPTLSPPRSKFESWSPKDGVTESHALRMCLQWAWHHHSEATGEECPYDFIL
jgi:hypothetical protein